VSGILRAVVSNLLLSDLEFRTGGHGAFWSLDTAHGQGWLRVQNRAANDTSLPVLGLAATGLIMIFTENDVFMITHASYDEFSSRSRIYHISGMKESYRFSGIAAIVYVSVAILSYLLSAVVMNSKKSRDMIATNRSKKRS